MSKGFGSDFYNQSSNHQKQRQVIADLKQHRDRILGLAWLGYIKSGAGAVLFKPVKDGAIIDYIQRSRIPDADLRQVVNKSNHQLTAVVLYGCENSYTVVTLSGPKTPPECYLELPVELLDNQRECQL